MKLLSLLLIAIIAISVVIIGIYTIRQRINERIIVKTKIESLTRELEQARDQQSFCKEKGYLYVGKTVNELGKELIELKKQL